jgi:hypothetical protein
MLKSLTILAVAALAGVNHWWIVPDWWLVIVAGATGGVIGWQSWETRKAAQGAKETAEATLQSVRMQEAGMKQWVELDGWKSEVMPDSKELAISFQVSNPTNFLLTAEHGEISFTNPARTIFFIYRPAPLAPNKPLSVKFNIPLTPANMQALQSGTIGFSVDGAIVFMTALDVQVTQSFSGIITCNRLETKFEATVALNNLRSSPDQDKTQQNPN